MLNWNGLQHLQTFLPSVVAHSGNARLLLIDNASTDKSVEWVSRTYPGIDILVHPSNLGFTEGYNQGLVAVKTEYAVLLNSDVEVTPGWLLPLAERLESNQAIAAVQPKVLAFRDKNQFEYAGAAGGFIDSLGYPFCRGRIFDTCESDSGQYNEAIPVFWATGACMMVRMEAYKNSGGLEPRFFAHMEEIDLCWRWALGGWQVWAEPASVVYHLGAGTLAKSSPRKTFLNFRNGLCMLYTNTIDASIVWKLPVRLVLDGMAGIQLLARGEWVGCLAIIRAHFAFYRHLSYWNRKRTQTISQKKVPVPETIMMNRSLVYTYFVLGKKTWSSLFSG